MRHIYHLSFNLIEHKIDLIQLCQLLVFPEQKLDLIQHYKLLVFPFNFHLYPTHYQLKWTASSLPCWFQNQSKIIIMLPKIKVLLERGQELYTEKRHIPSISFNSWIDWVPYQIRLRHKSTGRFTTIH